MVIEFQEFYIPMTMIVTYRKHILKQLPKGQCIVIIGFVAYTRNPFVAFVSVKSGDIDGAAITFWVSVH